MSIANENSSKSFSVASPWKVISMRSSEKEFSLIICLFYNSLVYKYAHDSS